MARSLLNLSAPLEGQVSNMLIEFTPARLADCDVRLIPRVYTGLNYLIMARNTGHCVRPDLDAFGAVYIDILL